MTSLRPDGKPMLLVALAAYAERVIAETDGMWPPHARATARGEALQNIATECRKATTDEGVTCPQ